MAKNPFRLPYDLYRCKECGRMLTALEIIERWEAAEAGGPPASTLCRCGSKTIKPTNPAGWREEFSPRAIRCWWVRIARPWLRGKR